MTCQWSNGCRYCYWSLINRFYENRLLPGRSCCFDMKTISHDCNSTILSLLQKLFQWNTYIQKMRHRIRWYKSNKILRKYGDITAVQSRKKVIHTHYRTATDSSWPLWWLCCGSQPAVPEVELEIRIATDSEMGVHIAFERWSVTSRINFSGTPALNKAVACGLTSFWFQPPCTYYYLCMSLTFFSLRAHSHIP